MWSVIDSFEEKITGITINATDSEVQLGAVLYLKTGVIVSERCYGLCERSICL